MTNYPQIFVIVAFALNAGLSILGLGVKDLLKRQAVGNLSKYTSTPSFNDGKCSVIHGVGGCEDIVFHRNEAFMSCQNLEDRNDYYPPLGRFNKTTRTHFRDPLYRYNANTAKLDEIKLIGVEENINHGISIYPLPNDPSTIHIFMVNHAGNRSHVNILSHKLGSKVAKLERTIQHVYILTPNDLTPTGPFSFYVTNDHKFRSGWGRAFESHTGLWRWTNAVHCSAEGEVSCIVAATDLVYANGIYATENDVFIADSLDGSVKIYERSFGLQKLRQRVGLEVALDNITPMPNGDLMVAAFPDPAAILRHLANESIHSPSMVLVLDRNTYSARPVLKTDKISGLTVGAIDPSKKVFLGGGVSSKGLLRCEIDSKWNV